MGTATFPQDPILVQLLIASQYVADPEPMIHDVMGFSKSYGHLLGDILATRQRLLLQLPETVLDQRGLLKEEFPYIFLFYQSAYEFLVGFFAIRALGGAAMPLSEGILPEEAKYFQSKTRASCILFGKGCDVKVAAICAAVLESDDSPQFASCSICTDAEAQVATNVAIDDAQYLDPSGPGIVFLTSGTSGPPKAAVLPRRSLAVKYLVPAGSASLNHRAGHWIGGADTMIEPILTGHTLHCIGFKATVDEVLQAYVNNRITHAMFAPRVLASLKDTIVGPSGILSDDVKAKYSDLFRGLPTILCGGNFIDPAVASFWVELTGRPLQNFYASTECGIRGCIGTPVEGVEMKLSREPVGEIRLRSATMFTHEFSYIGDMEATRAAFDADGFMKTGDLGKLQDGQYYILGRENIDSAEVERALLNLPYISEACVIGVPFRNPPQLCAAIIREHPAQDSGSSRSAASRPAAASLGDVRSALQDSGVLPLYMLPFLLRVLGENEALPLTQSGKVAKGAALKAFFGGAGPHSADSLPAEVEVWNSIPAADKLGVAEGEKTRRAWDWGGLQTV
ncbi:Acyl-CoA synthetase family member 3, mitochondrial [Beauveria bassiana]|uniref:Acyl-CoA synthetase family member 3, mitochondrial n=1 Tax=Beauveria bassiana TaxID=176275 RepID=A0A2N6NNR6_BEABA|nr:Acyl-CoA synthetase family member 3, mitochondrial [Beauveria bassiana]